MQGASQKDLSASINTDIQKCLNEDMKVAYTYLGLQVKATPEGADIKGYLDPKVLTIEQTSGCLPFHAYASRAE